MKRSEFLASRRQAWASWIRDGQDPGATDFGLALRDVRAAEIAGVTWDPDEPEMAPSLRLYEGELAAQEGTSLRRLTTAEKEVAADAYNRLRSGELVPRDKLSAAVVISKTKGEKTVHYAVGPVRATREEAERDLREWFDKGES